MFDAAISANILHNLDCSLTPLFAIIASHTVSRRVSDRSVALAASCSSGNLYICMVDISETYGLVNIEIVVVLYDYQNIFVK